MKKRGIKILAYLVSMCLLFLTGIVKGQSAGNNPNSINWSYIDSKNVKVIFPNGNEVAAYRIANLINYISDSAAIGIGNKRRYLDLLLQTNQVISNGYVALAPFRSEFYATGIQNLNWLGSINWLDVLAIHEYRHALQFSNSKRGLTKLLYWLAGETAWSLAMNVAVPNWYLEGDAVFSETQLTNAGRGRTPYFFKEQRAQLLENKRYSYMKARNGSFKTLMPDHYRLGFAIINQISQDKGQEVWLNTLNKGAAYNGIFYSFSHSLKKISGYSTKAAYKKAYDSLASKWEREAQSLSLIQTTPLYNSKEKTPTNYEWPYSINDSVVICRKESFKSTPELVIISNGKMKHLINLGFSVVEPYLHYNDSVAVWTELQTDIRWLNRNYSVIMKYDLRSKRKQQLTFRSKLFSPALSADNKKLAAVRSNEKIENKLIILNANNGEIIDSVPNPNNDFITYPKWNSTNDELIFVAKRNSKIALIKYNTLTYEIMELTPWTYSTIEGICVGKEYVYYSSGYSGIDNIYAVNVNGNKKVFKISSVKVGAYMPSVNEKETNLFFSEFNRMGYSLSTQTLNITSIDEFNLAEEKKLNQIFTTGTIHTKNILEKEFNQVYEVKPYKGLFRGVKLHSWSFLPNQVSNQITLKADNILNDFSAEVTGGFNRNESKYFVNGRLTYSRLYLPFSLGISNSNRNTQFIKSYSDTAGWQLTTTKFNELATDIKLSLPLLIKHAFYNTKIITELDAKYILTDNYTISDVNSTKKSDYFYSTFHVSISNLRGKAYQNVFPKYGQELDIQISGDWKAQYVSRYLTEGTIYLPGLLNNHGIRLNAVWKKEGVKNSYLLADQTKHARGYTALFHDEEMKIGIDYQLPLIYPDWGFGGLMYFQRIRMDLFYDYSEVVRYGMYKQKNLNSCGVELYFDNKYFNILPLSVGTRFSVLLNKNVINTSDTSFEFFMSGTF